MSIIMCLTSWHETGVNVAIFASGHVVVLVVLIGIFLNIVLSWRQCIAISVTLVGIFAMTFSPDATGTPTSNAVLADPSTPAEQQRLLSGDNEDRGAV
jgi:hypothetical protein